MRGEGVGHEDWRSDKISTKHHEHSIFSFVLFKCIHVYVHMYKYEYVYMQALYYISSAQLLEPLTE